MLRYRKSGTYSFAFLPAGVTRFLCVLILLATVNWTLAGTWTWTGGGGNVNWSTTGNWNLGSAPTSSSTTDLIFAGSTNTGTALVPLNQNIGNPFQLNSLSFASGAGSFFLGGNPLAFTGATTSISQGSSNAQSIANNITASTNSTVTLTLTGNGTGIVTLSGTINSGNGKRDYAITKTGTSTFTLSGANTYGGATTISAGVLNIQNSSALGSTASSTSVASGAALQLEGGISVGNEALALNGSGVASDGALRNISGNNSYGGGITLGSASTIASDSGTLTLSGGIVNSGFGVTFDGASNISESGVISGTGALIKDGSGTLTLNATNTFSGGSTINGGTVIANSAASLGASSGAATINAGTFDLAATFSSTRNFVLGNVASTFMVDPTFTFTTTGVISGTGTLNKTGTGTMVLSGANTYTGATNVSAGTLQISASERIANTSDLNISGGTFDLQTFSETLGVVTLSSGTISGSGADTLTGSSYIFQSGTVSAVLAGTGTVTKNTAGTVTLSGSNTFTGSTTISAGILQVNTNNALGTTASGTTVASGAALKLNNVNYSTAEPLTLNGSGISNGGALTNSGTSTFAGPIDVATNATINAGGGILNFTGGISKNGTTLTIAGGGTVNITTNGITGSSPNSDLIVDGTTLVLSAANSYNGATTIQNSGTLKLGGNNVLPTAPPSALSINTSSTFDLASYSDGVASLTGDSTATIKNSVAGGTSTLTINPASGVSTTFAGVIAGTNGGTQGNIALQKNGAGALVLTGANTYSGSTTVNGGTLTVAAGSGSALASTSNVTVNSGGTVLLGASNQINNTATMTLAGGTFAKGNFSEGAANSAGMGTLGLSASGSHIDFGTGTTGVLAFALFVSNGNSLTIDNWTGIAGMAGDNTTDRLIFASDQTANLGSFLFNGYAAGAMEIDLGNGYFEITPFSSVPEPSTYVIGLLAFLLLPFHHRKQIGALFKGTAKRNRSRLSPAAPPPPVGASRVT
jgi:fibronectin-binding autotransporter adhesin